MKHYFNSSKYRVLDFCTQPPRRFSRRIWRAFFILVHLSTHNFRNIGFVPRVPAIHLLKLPISPTVNSVSTSHWVLVRHHSIHVVSVPLLLSTSLLFFSSLFASYFPLRFSPFTFEYRVSRCCLQEACFDRLLVSSVCVLSLIHI